MGWWRTRSDVVIGDAAADYVEAFGELGLTWVEATNLPAEVRERIDALYVEGIGRVPTDVEVSVLLAFCRG